MRLYLVRLFGKKKQEYSVSLTVKDADGTAVANVKGNFLSEFIQGGIGSYHGFDCGFKPPIVYKVIVIIIFLLKYNALLPGMDKRA